MTAQCYQRRPSIDQNYNTRTGFWSCFVKGVENKSFDCDGVVMASSVKRRAQDDLEGEQRLAKRFDLLNLDHDGKRYIPIQSRSSNSTSSQPLHNAAVDSNDYMQVEDTKDKVYIFDLNEELAEVESGEDTPVFIPDIEKHLMKLPKSVLIGDDIKAAANKQMILYRPPPSFTVPTDKDSVRKAIIETRRRAQGKQASQISDSLNGFVSSRSHGVLQTQLDGPIKESAPPVVVDDDLDAMDIG